MTPTFEKLKKGYFKITLIKTLSIALTATLFTIGGIVLATKLAEVSFGILYAILIGIGVGAVSAGLAFMLLHKKAKALAKRLDDEYALNEKVQTMLAFENDGGAMKKIQREDANTRLLNAPLSTIKFKGIWKYAIITLISIATLISSFIVPTKMPPQDEDPPFDLNQWQKLRLENLIEYVERSEIQDGAKTYTIEKLDDLILVLDETETESVMKTHVIKVIVDVDEKVDQVNSYSSIRKALGDTMTGDLIKFANAIKQLQYSASVEAFDDFRGIFTYETYTETAGDFVTETQTALLTCGYDVTDGLYASIGAFLTELQTLADSWNSYTETTFDLALNGENGIGGVYTGFASSAHAALVTQKNNRRVFDYVKNDLMDIFNLTEEDIPDLGNEDLDYQDQNNNGDGEDEGAAPGGIGSGGTDYAGDDLIFDPEKGYVLYGEVLGDYEDRMDDILSDDSIPQEIKDKIRDYFNSL